MSGSVHAIWDLDRGDLLKCFDLVFGGLFAFREGWLESGARERVTTVYWCIITSAYLSFSVADAAQERHQIEIGLSCLATLCFSRPCLLFWTSHVASYGNECMPLAVERVRTPNMCILSQVDSS